MNRVRIAVASITLNTAFYRWGVVNLRGFGGGAYYLCTINTTITMKITLTESFIDDLMSLSQESANQVLNTCRELMKLDNDAIEQYELSDDAPLPLRDIVANMKKRAVAARRRRERREAKALAQTQAAPVPVSPTPSTSGPTVSPELVEAINLLFSDTAITTSEHHALMHKLVVFITERINPTPAPKVSHSKSRRNRRRNRKRRRH